jgi:hypothetical protein
LEDNIKGMVSALGLDLSGSGEACQWLARVNTMKNIWIKKKSETFSCLAKRLLTPKKGSASRR